MDILKEVNSIIPKFPVDREGFKTQFITNRPISLLEVYSFEVKKSDEFVNAYYAYIQFSKAGLIWVYPKGSSEHLLGQDIEKLQKLLPFDHLVNKELILLKLFELSLEKHKESSSYCGHLNNVFNSRLTVSTKIKFFGQLIKGVKNERD